MNDMLTSYTTKRLEKENFLMELPERINYAYSTLKYNQDLIQFAESKANTLLVINSIFLATITGITGISHGAGLMGTILGIMKILFLVIAICSVITCLMVVAPAKGDFKGAGRRDLIFYKDILRHNTPEAYRFEFCKTQTPQLLEDLLKRCYSLSHITDLKFNRYNLAQRTTFISCILWLGCIFIYYII